MKRCVAFAVGLLSVPTAGCTPTAGSHSSVTDSSISRDEMAIYEVVLASWLGKERGQQFVNEKLSGAPSTDACTKGLNFSATTQDATGKKSLAGVRFKRDGIKLIDGSKWTPADPQQGIANGKSVDAAVSEGFSKSLISFSEIGFSRDGNDALVNFGMSCGSLCGSGYTIHLRKSATGWAILNRCDEWVS